MDSGYTILGNSKSTFAKVEAKMEAARKRLEPWLWVISLTGFGIAIWNVRRVLRNES